MAKAGFDTHPRLSALPCGHQQITSVSAAVGLTAPTTRGPVNAAIIKAQGKDVRWRDDGTNPTASIGILLATTDPPLEYTGDLSAIKFIETAASATLDVSYYELP
jgi:hypothetical protein